jgi:hypothetical protein
MNPAILEFCFFLLEKWLCRYLLLLEEQGLLEWWVHTYALANQNRANVAELVHNDRLDGKADVPSRYINQMRSMCRTHCFL